MQAQYGKDVLGSVRLEEARKHQKASRILKETTASEEDSLRRRALLQEAKEESKNTLQSRKHAGPYLLLRTNCHRQSMIH